MAAEEKSVRRIPGINFGIESNAVVSLRLLALNQDFRAEYVGQIDNQYILLRIPHIQSVREKLLRDNGVVVRYQQKGDVCLFNSHVIKYVHSPCPLFFISYPETIACQGFRRSTRVRCSLPCLLQGRFGEHDGLLTDLSLHGASVVCRLENDASLRKFQSGDPAVLNFSLGEHGEVMAGVKVRRMENVGSEKVKLGLEFEDLDEMETEALNEFLDRLAGFLDVN
ncbi:flagellar brake protein [Desulfohalovibrio reitneri]|uniref:flagellar brake protein n=1 Tax=Desulfohalovibrio reitneri TaxID=1307759 RepID=UPI0004A73D5B|nr:flagellar brake protein [Desulfohalovibrio reitneri]